MPARATGRTPAQHRATPRDDRVLLRRRLGLVWPYRQTKKGEIMNLSQHYHQHDRFEVAASADYCVRWLKSQGFEVLAVSDGPRILVRSGPLCDRLEGAVQGY